MSDLHRSNKPSAPHPFGPRRQKKLSPVSRGLMTDKKLGQIKFYLGIRGYFFALCNDVQNVKEKIASARRVGNQEY